MSMKMAAATVTVGTSEGSVEIKCAEVEVPTDRDGSPQVLRVAVDDHNNLRVLKSETAFMLFHHETWVSVHAEQRPIVLEAVKNAS